MILKEVNLTLELIRIKRLLIRYHERKINNNRPLLYHRLRD